jgi:hypothetical protein
MATASDLAGNTPKMKMVWFQAFKYGVYVLLVANIFLFLHEEWLAASQVFTDGIALDQFVSAFAQTIDTAAWVVLLLLFELETFVLAGRPLAPWQQHAMRGVRVLCCLLILYAFYGYASSLPLVYHAVPAGTANLCGIADPAIFLVDFYEYVTVTAANCATLAATPPFYALPAIGADVVTDAAHLVSARHLVWTDVINAGDWLVVVAMLELDVRLKARGLLTGWRRHMSQGVKVVLYAVLLGCAIYWWVADDFMGFWDAFLWLVAFVFIEMNVFGIEEATTPARGAG